MRWMMMVMLLLTVGTLGCDEKPWCRPHNDIFGERVNNYPCCSFWIVKSWTWCAEWHCRPMGQCNDGWGEGSTGSDAGTSVADMCGGGSDASVCEAITSTATTTNLEYRIQDEVLITCKKGSVNGTTSLKLRYDDFSPDGYLAQIGQYVPARIQYTEWVDKGVQGFRANIAVVRKVIGKPITHLGSFYGATEWYCNMDPAFQWIKANFPNGL